MADSEALRSRRSRAHKAGDHSLCRACDQDAAGRQRSGLGWPGDGAYRCPVEPRRCATCGGSMCGLSAKRKTCSAECARTYNRERSFSHRRTQSCSGGCGKLVVLGGASSGAPKCHDCRRRDNPKAECRGGCGKVMPYKRGKPWMCLECCRKRPGYKGKWEPRQEELEPRRCDVCSNVYVPRKSNSRTCGPACADELKRSHKRNIGRLRHAMIVASRDALDPLAVEHEAAMRRRARRCPMPGCGVKLSDKPGLPNSKELDHIVPRCLGGAHTIGNTRIICRLCNARRPDDGSDIDQLDLFSVLDPAAIAVAQAPRVRKQITPPKRKTCGACGAAAQRGGGAWCAVCIADRGRRAAEMRCDGMPWQQISDTLGLGSPGSAYNLAKRFANSAEEIDVRAA